MLTPPTETTDSPYISEADDHSFQERVIMRSLERPVLVDFQAEWCGPCKQLGPLIEGITGEYKGRFELVKVDVDEAQQVAMAMRIQSIPMLVLFADARPVDALMGMQTRAEICAFLDRHVPAGEDDPLELGAAALEDGDYVAAAEAFESALSMAPDDGRAHLGRARAALAVGELSVAQLHLDQITADDPLATQAAQLRGVFEFAPEAGDLQQLLARVEAEAGDLDAHYALAATYALAGRFDEACEQLLSIIRRDRSYREDGARTALLTLFAVMGGEGATRYRKKLGALLF